MYYITEMMNGLWQCYCKLQDDRQIWTEANREKAVQALIRAARVLNNSYIREDDIEFLKQENSIRESKISDDDMSLLEQIRSKHKIVLNFDDPRIKMRITNEECEMVQKIREGDLLIVPS